MSAIAGGALGGSVQLLAKSPFVRSVTMVAGGAAFAQVIGVALSPVLTRLYGPEAYGATGMFTSIVSLLAPLSTLSLHSAITIASDEGDAKALGLLSLVLGTLMSVLCCALLLPFHEVLAKFLNFPGPSWLLLLLPVAVFVVSIIQTLERWMVRANRLRQLTAISIGQAAVLGAAKVGAGLASASAVSLIGTNVAAWCVQLLILRALSPSPFEERGLLRAYGSALRQLVRLREAFRAYQDFPLFRTPQEMVSAASTAMAIVLVTVMFGARDAGLFSVALTILALPISVIESSMGMVLVPRLAGIGGERVHEGSLILRSTAGLALVGLIPFGLVAAVGPSLFQIVFGHEWTEAGEQARWLSMMLYARFFAIPVLVAFPVFRLQRARLVSETSSLLLRLLALLIVGQMTQSVVIAVIAFSIVGLLSTLATVGWFAVKRWR